MKKFSFHPMFQPKRAPDSVKTPFCSYQKLSRLYWIRFTGEACLLCIVINHLFYQKALAFLFLLPLAACYIFQRKKQELKHRKNRLWLQFRDALSALQVSISAGYSLENAIKETRKDLERIYGKKGEMVLEFHYMEIQLEHGVSIDKLLNSLGSRSGIEDIQNFSQILIQSKKMGGNMRRILQECIASMEEQMDVKKEIQAMLASRRLEQRIMSILPLGIILYMQLSSPSFLSVLYGNPVGIGIMTLCLGIYLFAYQWGERLVEIEI